MFENMKLKLSEEISTLNKHSILTAGAVTTICEMIPDLNCGSLSERKLYAKYHQPSLDLCFYRSVVEKSIKRIIGAFASMEIET